MLIPASGPAIVTTDDDDNERDKNFKSTSLVETTHHKIHNEVQNTVQYLSLSTNYDGYQIGPVLCCRAA